MNSLQRREAKFPHTSVYSGSSNAPQILTATNHYNIIYQYRSYFYEISIIYFDYYYFIIKTTIEHVIIINMSSTPVTPLFIITTSFDYGTTAINKYRDSWQHWQECGGDARKWTRFGRHPVALSRGTEHGNKMKKEILLSL